MCSFPSGGHSPEDSDIEDRIKTRKSLGAWIFDASLGVETMAEELEKKGVLIRTLQTPAHSTMPGGNVQLPNPRIYKAASEQNHPRSNSHPCGDFWNNGLPRCLTFGFPSN
jgi:hypothetical protein